jgi:quinol monooxygenase YgiN
MTSPALPGPGDPVVVVAEIEVHTGRRKEALAAMERVCAATHERDPGCLLYALHTDVEGPERLVMVEKWASFAALEAHRRAGHSLAFGREESIAGVSRLLVLRADRVGDPALGTL